MKALILIAMVVLAVGCGRDFSTMSVAEKEALFAPVCAAVSDSTDSSKTNFRLIWSSSSLQNDGCCAYASVNNSNVSDLLTSLGACRVVKVGSSYQVDCWAITSNENQPTGADPASCKWKPF